MRRLRILVAVLAIMALALPVSAGGREKVSVNEFGTTIATGGFASINRDTGGVDVDVHLRDLTPGAAITVWFVQFTDCGGDACTGADIALEGNGAIWSKIGGVVNPAGNFNGNSYVAVGEDTGGPVPLPLADAEGAEIHFVVQEHGPALTGADLVAQTTTFMGACGVGEPNEGQCFDPQSAVFLFPTA